jgi:hypothetical protein
MRSAEQLSHDVNTAHATVIMLNRREIRHETLFRMLTVWQTPTL